MLAFLPVILLLECVTGLYRLQAKVVCQRPMIPYHAFPRHVFSPIFGVYGLPDEPRIEPSGFVSTPTESIVKKSPSPGCPETLELLFQLALTSYRIGVGRIHVGDTCRLDRNPAQAARTFPRTMFFPTGKCPVGPGLPDVITNPPAGNRILYYIDNVLNSLRGTPVGTFGTEIHVFGITTPAHRAPPFVFSFTHPNRPPVLSSCKNP